MSNPIITEINADTVQIDLPDGRGFRLEWAELGEGYNGDHDPDDPHDAELLRLDLLVKDADTTDGWTYEEHDGSFCTCLPVADPNRRIALVNLAFLFAPHISNPDRSHSRFMEAVSHVGPVEAASQPALAALISKMTAPYGTRA